MASPPRPCAQPSNRSSKTRVIGLLFSRIFSLLEVIQRHLTRLKVNINDRGGGNRLKEVKKQMQDEKKTLHACIWRERFLSTLHPYVV